MKGFIRFISLLLAASLLFSACSSGPSGGEDAPETSADAVVLSHRAALYEAAPEFNRYFGLSVVGDRLYGAGTVYTDDGPEYSLYAVNPDGSTDYFDLPELTDTQYLSQCAFSEDGESLFLISDYSDGRHYLILITDADGRCTELPLDTSAAASSMGMNYCLARGGYWYVITNYDLFVLDIGGSTVFTYTLPDYCRNLFAAEDGVHVYGTGYHLIVSPGGAKQADDWKKLTDDMTVYAVTGGIGCDYFVGRARGLYAGTIGGGEEVAVDWGSSDVYGSGVKEIYMTSEDTGYLLIGETGKDRLYAMGKAEGGDTVVLSRSDTIRLAYFSSASFDPMQEIAAKFNRSHPDIRIVAERLDPAGDYRGEVNKELAAGIGPDILYTYWLDADSYIDKGVLVNLYDAGDASLTPDELFGCVRSTFERDGAIYEIPYEFRLVTIAAPKGYVGGEWNLDRFMELYDEARAEGDSLIYMYGRKNLVADLKDVFWTRFIDTDAGTCSFDSEECVNTIKWLDSLPEEGMNLGIYSEDIYLSGSVRMDYALIGSLKDYVCSLSRWGADSGEIIGLPYADGGGTALTYAGSFGINSASPNIDRAMEFLRLYLTDDDARDPLLSRISPVRSVAVKTIKKKVGGTIEYNPLIPGQVREASGNIPEKDRDRSKVYVRIGGSLADEFIDFIDSAVIAPVLPQAVRTIIYSEVNSAAGRSAEQTAEIIQSRVKIWLSERG